MHADLIARCATFGWILHPDGDGWELLGNGAPAAFRSTETLQEWLDKQELPKHAPTTVAAHPTYAQVAMELI